MTAVGGPAARAIPRRPGGPRQVLYWLAKRLLLPLARARRRRLRHTLFVAVTGSGGKTTTKNLIHEVLAAAGPGTASRGSSNRAKGVLRVLARTRRHHRFSVHEVAAWAPGTLDELLWALEPRVGVVTSVGREHYLTFRGADEVAREKAKLVRALPAGGLAVLNADDPRVRAMAAETAARVLLVGRSAEADLRAEEARSAWPDPLAFVAVHAGRRVPVTTRLHGEHWLPAVLAALAVGLEAGLPLAAAAAAVARVEPQRHRLSEVRLAGGITFLEDDWKAPTWSLDAAFEVLRTARARRRILVLGQLSDDPANPRQLYRRVARRALASADVVLAVGRWSGYALAAGGGDRLHAFATAADCHRFLAGFLAEGDLVLVKATAHHEHLERLVLARREEVACWRHACGRRLWCDGCSLRWRSERAPQAPVYSPR